MHKKKFLLAFLLSFTLLAACSNRVLENVDNPDDEEPVPQAVSTNEEEDELTFDGEIVSPLIDRIISKVEVRLASVKNYDLTIKETSDATKTELHGAYEEDEYKEHGFYTGSVLKAAAEQKKHKVDEYGAFNSADPFTMYFFSIANINGVIFMRENDGANIIGSRTTFNPNYKGEKLTNYRFNSYIDMMKNHTDAYYDNNGDLHILKTEDTSNSQRIQLTQENEGFIAVTENVRVAHFYLKKLSNNYYDYRLDKMVIDEYIKTNVDENNNNLKEMVLTHNSQTELKIEYEKALETDVLTVNTRQLLNAFNSFTGTVNFDSGNENKTELKLSELYVDEASFSTIHHYYGIIGANRGDICRFSGNGTYKYMAATPQAELPPLVDEEEEEEPVENQEEVQEPAEPVKVEYEYSLKSKNGNFTITLPLEAFDENTFQDLGDGTFRCVRNVVMEVDLYLLISNVLVFSETAAPSEALEATVIKVVLNEF